MYMVRESWTDERFTGSILVLASVVLTQH